MILRVALALLVALGLVGCSTRASSSPGQVSALNDSWTIQSEPR
jgi:hypothetical protein